MRDQRGALFESLMTTYLTTDPTYTSRFDKVWRWVDYSALASSSLTCGAGTCTRASASSPALALTAG